MMLLAGLALLYVTDSVLGYWGHMLAGEEGKCGCCPKPCCCHCIQNKIPQTITTTTPDIGTTTDFYCYATRQQDLVFIIDESGSIGYEDWEVVKQFVADVVETFTDIGENGQKVAMVTYSNNASVRWNFNDATTMNKLTLLEAILGMDILHGGFTNTAEGLLAADTFVFNAEGDRHWPSDSDTVPNVAVVITDGRANFRLHEYEQIANNLKETATVIVIGITNNINMTELQMIASASELVFTVNDFNDLRDILKDIQIIICTTPIRVEKPTTPIPTQLVYFEEECFCCCPPPSTLSYGPGHKRCC